MITLLANIGFGLFIIAIFLSAYHIAYRRGTPRIMSLQRIAKTHRHPIIKILTVSIVAFIAIPPIVNTLVAGGFSLKALLFAVFLSCLFRLGKEFSLSNQHSFIGSVALLAAWALFPDSYLLSTGISILLCIAIPIAAKDAPIAIAFMPPTVLIFADPINVFGLHTMTAYADNLANTPAVLNLSHNCSVSSIGTLDIAFP